MSTPLERATDWLLGHDTGLSYMALCGHMMGKKRGHWATQYPHDNDDLGRCLRLLALVPEWRQRVPEMAAHGPYWTTLVSRWDEIEAALIAEVGLDGSRRSDAPTTYALMRSILDPIHAKDSNFVDLGNGCSVRFS